MNIIMKTADQLHKAEVTIEPSYTPKDLIETAVLNWSLPTDTDYNLVNTTKNITIASNATLASLNIQEGDVLEIQPVLVAG